MAEDSGNAVATMIDRVWATPVSEEQLKTAQAFVEARFAARKDRKLALADLAVVLFNSSQFVYVD